MSAGDINLQRIFFVFRIFFSVTTAAAAVARTFLVRVLASSSSSSEEDSGDAMLFPHFSSSIN
jgi:hypothetical protein